MHILIFDLSSNSIKITLGEYICIQKDKRRGPHHTRNITKIWENKRPIDKWQLPSRTGKDES